MPRAKPFFEHRGVRFKVLRHVPEAYRWSIYPAGSIAAAYGTETGHGAFRKAYDRATAAIDAWLAAQQPAP